MTEEEDDDYEDEHVPHSQEMVGLKLDYCERLHWSDTVCLDGNFSVEQLEAVLRWMKETPAPEGK